MIYVDKEITLIYDGDYQLIPELDYRNYDDSLFDLEIELESEAFYEIRKINDIKPYNIKESSKEDLDNLKKFFNDNKNNFYFFFYKNKELIGSVLIIENTIKSLAVSKKYRLQGYGQILAKFAINKILLKGYKTVLVNILKYNNRAYDIFKKIGFREK